jgi:hypothetical protein
MDPEDEFENEFENEAPEASEEDTTGDNMDNGIHIDPRM